MLRIEQGYLGNQSSEVVFYLPTPPVIATDGSQDTARIIADNGNHWRKILTIMAKLTSTKNDWRQYRDDILLSRNESISFNHVLSANANIHIICGKQTWAEMNLDITTFQQLNGDYPTYQSDNVILCPYLDYRQFPNVLVEQLKPIIATFTAK